jgi:hypothetical protein
MFEIKSIKRKHPPTGFKWEVITKTDEYVIIRYKDKYLDVRVSKSYDEFVLGNNRAIYRSEIHINERNNPFYALLEVLKILEIELDNNVDIQEI